MPDLKNDEQSVICDHTESYGVIKQTYGTVRLYADNTNTPVSYSPHKNTYKSVTTQNKDAFIVCASII